MLTDLRQSIKDRDSNMIMEQQYQESIGEKMSLAGDSSALKYDANSNLLFYERGRMHMTPQSESGQETYSSKQYRVNPLLLDE